MQTRVPPQTHHPSQEQPSIAAVARAYTRPEQMQEHNSYFADAAQQHFDIKRHIAEHRIKLRSAILTNQS